MFRAAHVRGTAGVVARTRNAGRRRFGTDMGNRKGENLFGEPPLAPGQKRKWEEWELPYVLAMGGGFAFLTIGLIFKPDTTIRSWAKDEVLARELLEAQGEEIEVGRNYSQEKHGIHFVKPNLGERPVLVRDQ